MRLFLTLFLVIVSGLAAVTAGFVALASHLFHWDVSAWTQVTAWNSLPVLVGAVELAVSVVLATGLTLAWKVMMGIVGAASKPPKKTRPQSRRKTWS